MKGEQKVLEAPTSPIIRWGSNDEEAAITNIVGRAHKKATYHQIE
jgi:hypothetical protein